MQAPPSASENGSLASGAAACPSAPPSAGLPSALGSIPAACPTVHPTQTVHGAVPPTGAASLLVGDGEEERENVGLLANPEDKEEEESVEDDGGIEVADEVVQAKDIFQAPRELQPPLPYVPRHICDIDNFTMAELLFLFFTNNINPANDWKAGMISP